MQYNELQKIVKKLLYVLLGVIVMYFLFGTFYVQFLNKVAKRQIIRQSSVFDFGVFEVF